MSKTIVFVETSLTQLEAKAILHDAVYVSSIKKGDVVGAIKNGYDRIVIIDGNFGWTPSVWHKEILMALDYGIEVFGASSMGALRAAELDSYGMKGIGRVYEMYKNGVIDGDDEVAIAYSLYDNTQTVALINLRVTLDKLNLELTDAIINRLKQIYYADRTWIKIAECLTDDQYNLIQSNYIDIKKEDAISLLNYIKTLPVKNKLNYESINRPFTLFEKKLMESVCYPVVFSQLEFKNNGDFNQLIRAKNIIKLLSLSKTKLRYYQSLIYLHDTQNYIINESELMDQISLFREEKNLLLGNDFRNWLIKKHLFNSNLEVIFMDLIKLNKYLLITFNFNNYLR